ncbi:VOC family protein [Spirosoma luteolum]
MRIDVCSLLVSDQQRALAFYTDVLGFTLRRAVPMGEMQWLTIASAEQPDGVELLLEPMQFEPAQVYQRALYEAGIPAMVFTVDDVDKTYQQLVERGVQFSVLPTDMGPVRLAVLDDTCGNRIQLVMLR